MKEGSAPSDQRERRKWLQIEFFLLLTLYVFTVLHTLVYLIDAFKIGPLLILGNDIRSGLVWANQRHSKNGVALLGHPVQDPDNGPVGEDPR